MSKPSVYPPSILTKFWSWLNSHFIGEVPSESALCEFDCRKPQCLDEDWAHCERRLTRAAGELMPGPSAQSNLNEKS
jgi:hypothetical protein